MPGRAAQTTWSDADRLAAAAIGELLSVFVLVHGAGHGGWCWKRLAPLLRAGGHEVYAPTLTGLGERSHLAHPEVGLETHVKDVAALIKCEDLTEVVLVGHSYGGMVIAGVAGRSASRIKRVVYLDAFVPEDGESLADIKGPEWRNSVITLAKETGEGWRLPPPSSRYFDVTDEEDVAWADARLTPQPLKTFLEPVRIANEEAKAIPAAFISCTAQEDGFEYMRARIEARGWPWLEIAAGHDAMITEPEALARLLLDLA